MIVEDYINLNEITFVTIVLFFPIYIGNKFLKFKQLKVLTGDSITHILFHNLRLLGCKSNICGVVGGTGLNLPSLLYKYSSFFFGKFSYYNRFNVVVYSNLILLTLLELLVFFALLMSKGLDGALLGLLCAGLIPSVSVLSWAEIGSYSKFSERFLALLANGLYVYLSLRIALGSHEIIWVLLATALLVVSIYLGKFSRQVVVYWSIIINLIIFDVILLVPIAACFLAFILDKDLRNEIYSQIIYLRNYKSYQGRNFEISEKLAKKLLFIPFLANSRIIRIYIRLFLHSGWGIILMLPTAYCLFIDLNPNAALLFYSAIFIGFMTTTHIFYFIGSGDRYMYNLLTIPAFLSISSLGPSVHLVWINGLIVLVYILSNITTLNNIEEDVNKKCAAFIEFFQIVGKKSTVFFDHYKDGEIYQLINDLYTDEFKTSTSQGYLWDQESKKIFSNYPMISLSQESLEQYNVDYIITRKSFQGDNFKLIHDISGYKLYYFNNLN